jgi:hypothetical protein
MAQKVVKLVAVVPDAGSEPIISSLAELQLWLDEEATVSSVVAGTGTEEGNYIFVLTVPDDFVIPTIE